MEPAIQAKPARRKSYTYRQTITAEAAAVFPLLCPVRERQWLAGWECKIVHSSSGLAEPGCVFTTRGEDEPATVWVIARHDEAAGAIQFVRFTPGNRTCVLDIAVSPAPGGSSYVDIRYTYTSLSGKGDAFLERMTEEEFLSAVTFWERSMNHWFETGEQLQPER